MENIYRWDRDDKLFAIQGLKASQASDRSNYLLQLVIDDDPVVRGKAALALQDCEDEVLIEAADALLDQNENQTTILACEILGFTGDVDFSDRVKKLLTSEDDRVVRSTIEILDELPEESMLDFLDWVVSNYSNEWSKSLFRLFNRLHTDKLVPLLEELIDKVDTDNRASVLRVWARVISKEESDRLEKLRAETKLSDEQGDVLDWLVELEV